MEGISSEALIQIVSIIAAALVMFVGLGVSIAQGMATTKAVESIARQPEAKGDIMSTMFVGMAMTETSEIFALVISIILLFANPFV